MIKIGDKISVRFEIKDNFIRVYQSNCNNGWTTKWINVPVIGIFSNDTYGFLFPENYIVNINNKVEITNYFVQMFNIDPIYINKYFWYLYKINNNLIIKNTCNICKKS